MDRAALQRDLLAWYDRRRRDLPWRASRDPYAVWVSEVMLQQTRVETVVPFFRRWMERFPTLADLAAADEEEVLALWSGLGYYARARKFHQAARQVMEDHGGRIPDDPDRLGLLPGVGPYTAGAIASIAFGRPVPAVDGNVERVVSRLYAITADLGSATGRRRVHDAAAELVDPQRPGDWNQAVMELGAMVCTPRPRCGECPMEPSCEARSGGLERDLPRRRPKKPPRPERVHFGLVMGEGRVLLVKRPPDGLLGGTWALPGGTIDIPLARHLSDQAAVQVQVSDSAAQARHAFTHRIWDMRVYMCHMLDVEPRETVLPVRWVPLNRLDAVGLSTAMKKAIGAAGMPVP